MPLYRVMIWLKREGEWFVFSRARLKWQLRQPLRLLGAMGWQRKDIRVESATFTRHFTWHKMEEPYDSDSGASSRRLGKRH